MSFNYQYEDEKSIHQRQGNEPQQQPDQPEKYFPTPEELVKNIFSVKPPEPVFDRDKADRLQRMGRINSLGRSIGVLGDVLSLGLGANVRRRQPDTISPAIYASYESMMDKYKNEGDAHRFALYQKQLQDAQLGITHGYRREDQAWREKAHGDELQTQRDKNSLDFAKWQATWEQRERQNQAGNRLKEADLGLKAQKLHQDRELAIARALQDYAKDNSFMEVMVNGQIVKLAEGEYRGILAEARKYFSEEDFETMMSPYVNQPIEGLKNIVQRYSEFKFEQDRIRAQNSPANLQRQQPIIDETVDGGSFHNPYNRFQGAIPYRDPSVSGWVEGSKNKSEDFDSSKYLRK